MNMEEVLPQLSRLRPVRFTWNTECPNPLMRSRQDYGLIAQEVEGELPDLVRKAAAPSQDLLVRYEKLTIYLLKAVNELHARVQELERGSA